MTQFYKEYQVFTSIGQQPVAQLKSGQIDEKGQQPVGQLAECEKAQQLVLQIPWGHNIILMQKIKDRNVRYWYMQQVLERGLSRGALSSMIKSGAHKRYGKVISNFKTRLPTPQSDLVQQMLKDPYIFDFTTLEEPFHERELETGLIKHLERFLIELGQGFAFVGRQYHVPVSDNDFYIDLLFYHLKLRSYIVIELKKGAFKPEYAGKMNFYCSIVDDKLKGESDNPTIGLILCQDRDRILVEYALRDMHKPIGVSGYELTQKLPSKLRSSLPSVEQIESELLAEGKTVR
jgi:predicted nuclease of restriction endonuclease-like (RecB) superfamily